ncbi:MAG: thioesterase family protein [Solirubrobacterales bacterium]|nr:thioesterase family protein [Solirubrobacterales bacterium]
MRPGLVIGAPHIVRYTVPMHQTVPGLLPALAEFRRGQPVFATGFMVGLMEAPCMAAVYPHLEPGEVTVGTLINMTHVAPSPPGTSLLAEARARAIDGRSVHFDVVVADHAGEVAAAGEHALRVIDVAQFRDRLAAKQAQLRHHYSADLSSDHQRLGRQQQKLPVTAMVKDGTRARGRGLWRGKHLTTTRERKTTRQGAKGGGLLRPRPPAGMTLTGPRTTVDRRATPRP